MGIDTCFPESSRSQVIPMLAPLIHICYNTMDMMVYMQKMFGANFSLTETVIDTGRGMSGTMKDMVNVLYPLLKEEMINMVEYWLHESSMESMEPMWKGKHNEGDESMESLEHIDPMDAMRSLQPIRPKKISRGPMLPKESSMESMWKMKMMKMISDEQRLIVTQLEDDKHWVWFLQIIFESLDMEKVVRHKNTQMMVTDMVHMAAMMVEQKDILMEMIPGLVCVMERCMEDHGMPMEPGMKEMMEMYLERIIQAGLLVAESPNLPQGINRMMMAVVSAIDMEPGRMESFVWGLWAVIDNLQQRVKGMDGEKIVETIMMCMEKLRAVMNGGDWTRIKKMMEHMEEVIKTEAFWRNMQVINNEMDQMLALTAENLYNSMEMTALTMEMIKEECVGSEDPMLCCLMVRIENGVGMLEGLGINMDYTMDMMEPWIADMVGHTGQVMVSGVWMMVPFTEQYGMACIMEEFGMGLGMMEWMKEWMVQMAVDWIGEGEAPVNSINVMMDSKMKVHELLMGVCP